MVEVRDQGQPVAALPGPLQNPPVFGPDHECRGEVLHMRRRQKLRKLGRKRRGVSIEELQHDSKASGAWNLLQVFPAETIGLGRAVEEGLEEALEVDIARMPFEGGVHRGDGRSPDVVSDPDGRQSVALDVDQGIESIEHQR